MAEEINLFEAPEEPSFFIGQVQSDIFDSPDSFYKVLLLLRRSLFALTGFQPCFTRTSSRLSFFLPRFTRH